MIKVLSYVAKMKSNKDETNSVLIKLMKNLDMKFQEKSTKVKYEEYFFNLLSVIQKILSLLIIIKSLFFYNLSNYYLNKKFAYLINNFYLI